MDMPIRGGWSLRCTNCCRTRTRSPLSSLEGGTGIIGEAALGNLFYPLSMAPVPQKPISLLKRPHAPHTSAGSTNAPSTQPGLPDRVTETIRTIVDGALTRERARMHAVYVARQEALLKVFAEILRDDLSKRVSSAAEREATALAAAVRKISAEGLTAAQSLKESERIAPKKEMKAGKGGGVAIDVSSVRANFREAFESELLGAIETSLAAMMSSVSATIDTEAETAVAAPAADSAARALRSAADQVRSDTAHFSAVARVHQEAMRKPGDGGRDADDEEIEVATPVNKEDALMSEVARALGEGRVREAMRMSIGASASIRAKAFSGALDSGVAPEEVLSADEDGNQLTMGLLVGLIALLSADLDDRTNTRLSWLTEATMCLESAPRHETRNNREDIEQDIRLLSAAVEKLKAIQFESDAAALDIKQAKLVARCLNVTVQTLKEA